MADFYAVACVIVSVDEPDYELRHRIYLDMCSYHARHGIVPMEFGERFDDKLDRYVLRGIYDPSTARRVRNWLVEEHPLVDRAVLDETEAGD